MARAHELTSVSIDSHGWTLDRSGRVVHLGQSTVSFAMPGSPTLSVVSSSARGLVPGGLCLPAVTFERWRRRPERDLIASTHDFAAMATPVDLRVPRVTPHVKAVSSWQSQITAHTDTWLSPDSQRRLAPILAQALLSADPVHVANTMGQLIGRGPGSTPSGDDVIVGALAAIQALGLSTSAARPLSGQLSQTTAASRHDLWWALHGRVSQRLLSLLGSFASPHLVPAVAGLARGWGHTSGSDLAAGATAVFEASIRQPITLRSIA